MVINRNYLIVCLIFTGLVNLCSQCNKRLDCASTVYNFEIGVKAYPDRDSINVGDTIWIEVNELVTFKDANTGNMIEYSGASNLGTAISFAKLIAVSMTDDQVASKFKYILIYGQEIARTDTVKYREFRFSESSGSYEFKLGIIPKEQGVYKMFVSNAYNVYRNNDQCTKAGFAINFKETNQHFYLNEVSFPGIQLTGKNGVYLFKVK